MPNISHHTASCTFIAHPIGSLLGIIISDKFGRQKSILALTIPIAIAWIVLGFAESFLVICITFSVIGFSMGLKDAATMVFISEISSPEIRGALMATVVILHQFGSLIVFLCGAIFPWRIVAFICAACPFIAFATVIFVSSYLLGFVL